MLLFKWVVSENICKTYLLYSLAYAKLHQWLLFQITNPHKNIKYVKTPLWNLMYSLGSIIFVVSEKKLFLFIFQQATMLNNVPRQNTSYITHNISFNKSNIAEVHPRNIPTIQKFIIPLYGFWKDFGNFSKSDSIVGYGFHVEFSICIRKHKLNKGTPYEHVS